MTVAHPSQKSTSAAPSSPCGCASAGGGDEQETSSCCSERDLPINPFEDLNVAYGMLLGEEDFKVLMGNPRGKQWLHTSWLHGSGVVWGMDVEQAGEELQVLPGLAIDAVGRELRLEKRGWCVTAQSWAEEWRKDHPGKIEKDDDGCVTRLLEAWVVVEFACCLDRSVPTLADPCDVTRTHDGPSRVVETARVYTVAERPCQHRSFHRVRVLLGLEEPDDGDPVAGAEAAAAKGKVAEAAGDERAKVLLEWFRRLAARDVIDLKPHALEGDAYPPLTPVPAECSPVVLAKLAVRVREQGGCVEVLDIGIDVDVRDAIVPTATIEDLLCGLAPGIIGVGTAKDAGGPRLVPDSFDWTSDHTRLSFKVDRPLAPGSQEGAITVSSLADDGRGWADDDVERARITADGTTVQVFLDARPKYDLVRVVIHGTGPRPLYGLKPRVPFAGVHDGPPGTQDDGHDAVVTTHLRSSKPDEPRRSTS